MPSCIRTRLGIAVAGAVAAEVAGPVKEVKERSLAVAQKANEKVKKTVVGMEGRLQVRPLGETDRLRRRTFIGAVSSLTGFISVCPLFLSRCIILLTVQSGS